MKPAVMIDIETFDTIPTAVILSIGAVVMDMESLSVIHDQVFYQEINKNQPNRTTSLSTMDWWLERGNCPCKGTAHLPQALKDLANWLPEGAEIWCKGTDFDTQILSNAYVRHSLFVPWKYNSVRDCRTIFKTFPLPWDTETTHNALEDAKDQAARLMATLRGLNHGK